MRSIMLAALAATVVTGLLACPALAEGPSFDCRKAAAADEKAICADPQLSAIDVLVTKAFKGFQPAYGGSKRLIGRQLIADRHACGGDAACIASAMTNALGTFGDVPDWANSYAEGLIGRKAAAFAAENAHTANQPLPAAIGQCAMTHIAKLGTRLGDDPLQGAPAGSGVGIVFSNQGGQTSYDDIPAASAASVGDPVVMCLMSTPRDCPKDDVRGKFYYSVDLRTNGSWILPDAEHLCGGA